MAPWALQQPFCLLCIPRNLLLRWPSTVMWLLLWNTMSVDNVTFDIFPYFFIRLNLYFLSNITIGCDLSIRYIYNYHKIIHQRVFFSKRTKALNFVYANDVIFLLQLLDDRSQKSHKNKFMELIIIRIIVSVTIDSRFCVWHM